MAAGNGSFFFHPKKKPTKNEICFWLYVEAFKHVFGCFHIKQSKTDSNIHLLIENVFYFIFFCLLACWVFRSVLVIQFYIHRFEDPWNEFRPKNLNFRHEFGSCCACVPNTNSNCITGNWTRIVQMSEIFHSLHHHHHLNWQQKKNWKKNMEIQIEENVIGKKKICYDEKSICNRKCRKYVSITEKNHLSKFKCPENKNICMYNDGNCALCTRHFDDNAIIIIIIYYCLAYHRCCWMLTCRRVDRTAGRIQFIFLFNENFFHCQQSTAAAALEHKHSV